MKQKRIAVVLKLCSVGAALIGILFFFWYVPVLISECAMMYPEAAWLRWPGTFGIWVIALLCYGALWEFWKICTRIGADNSFCRENERSMKCIGILAFVTALLILGGNIFLGCVGFLSGAQMVASFFVICIACGIGIVCLALSCLIQNAAELKEENELTI